MRTRLRGFGFGLSAVAVLALIGISMQGSQRANSAPLIASVSAQDFEISPDTLVGWDRGPEQPVFYSHRRHAGEFEINCLYCHTNTDRSPIAPLPSLDVCFGCHNLVRAGSSEIQKLRGYRERGEAVPWVRIHKLADFVQFNHARHIQAELECQECHGEIEGMDVVYQFAPLTMGWCLECHREPADEAALADAARIAEKFEQSGPESRGLYPISIDSDYGVTRGPIDCAACHY
jgi:hypothetical protein